MVIADEGSYLTNSNVLCKQHVALNFDATFYRLFESVHYLIRYDFNHVCTIP